MSTLLELGLFLVQAGFAWPIRIIYLFYREIYGLSLGLSGGLIYLHLGRNSTELFLVSLFMLRVSAVVLTLLFRKP